LLGFGFLSELGEAWSESGLESISGFGLELTLGTGLESISEFGLGLTLGIGLESTSESTLKPGMGIKGDSFL